MQIKVYFKKIKNKCIEWILHTYAKTNLLVKVLKTKSGENQEKSDTIDELHCSCQERRRRRLTHLDSCKIGAGLKQWLSSSSQVPRIRDLSRALAWGATPALRAAVDSITAAHCAWNRAAPVVVATLKKKKHHHVNTRMYPDLYKPLPPNGSKGLAP